MAACRSPAGAVLVHRERGQPAAEVLGPLLAGLAERGQVGVVFDVDVGGLGVEFLGGLRLLGLVDLVEQLLGVLVGLPEGLGRGRTLRDRLGEGFAAGDGSGQRRDAVDRRGVARSGLDQEVLRRDLGRGLALGGGLRLRDHPAGRLVTHRALLVLGALEGRRECRDGLGRAEDAGGLLEARGALDPPWRCPRAGP